MLTDLHALLLIVGLARERATSIGIQRLAGAIAAAGVGGIEQFVCRDYQTDGNGAMSVAVSQPSAPAAREIVLDRDGVVFRILPQKTHKLLCADICGGAARVLRTGRRVSRTNCRIKWRCRVQHTSRIGGGEQAQLRLVPSPGNTEVGEAES